MRLPSSRGMNIHSLVARQSFAKLERTGGDKHAPVSDKREAIMNAALDLRNHAANLAEPAARQAIAELLRTEPS